MIEHHFGPALEAYSAAIEINPFVAVFYANRAYCHIKMEAYGAGLIDADKAIELDPDYTKVRWRLVVVSHVVA